MRIDELPRSEKSTTAVACGCAAAGSGSDAPRARPDRVGARDRSPSPDRRGGSPDRRPAIATAVRFRYGENGQCALRPNEGVRLRGARQHGGAVDGSVRAGQYALSASAPRNVLGGDLVGLRVRPSRHGAVLLPERPPRYLDTSFFEDLQRRFGACETEKACQFSQAYVIAHEIGHTCRTCSASCRACSRCNRGWTGATPTVCRSWPSCRRMLCRHMGEPLAAAMEVPRSGRRRDGLADGVGDRRRSPAAPITGLCGARRIHARLIPAARALVQHRAQVGRDHELRHVQRRAAFSAAQRRTKTELGRPERDYRGSKLTRVVDRTDRVRKSPSEEHTHEHFRKDHVVNLRTGEHGRRRAHSAHPRRALHRTRSASLRSTGAGLKARRHHDGFRAGRIGCASRRGGHPHQACLRKEGEARLSPLDRRPMRLRDLDSSMSARKELAQELQYSGNLNDSASMNVWLHKQVMQKLAANVERSRWT